ncbi:uncharacterized protein LOC126336358 [Schistocerca gregaria]|uniref:uncharacterized protein LOC126336358 n=1 Tax=Schistocerca gregaria TaxID=7010 RepID=UPI00211E7FFB|nr:uncharacterized protein LOC126336358 [Schistocerca gregaria]
MDCEKLISLVHERRSLWHPEDANYHNRDVARSLWFEIATLLETTSSNVKSKWQNLRDTYRRELAKNNPPTGSASVGSFSKWKYFHQMNFLQDTYASKRLVGNVPKSLKSDPADLMADVADIQVVSYNDETSLEDDSFSEQADDERYHSLTPDESVAAENLFKWAKKRPRKKTDPIYNLIELEKAKLVHLESMNSKKQKGEEYDEDYYFLMSLLPHLRAVPQHLKLITRVKLQQVLIENQAMLQKFPHSSHPTTSSHNQPGAEHMSNNNSMSI